jgi:hypothetical protein
MGTQERVIKPNYGMIKVDYGTYIVMPYKDAVQMWSALSNAKVYQSRYGEESIIRDFKADEFTFHIIGDQEYGEAILRETIKPSD